MDPRTQMGRAPTTKAIASSLTAAAASVAGPGQAGQEAASVEALRAQLQQAQSARDAAMLELADVVQHNALLLRTLREKGHTLESAVLPPAAAAELPPLTYSQDLLARRHAIAASTEQQLLLHSPRAPRAAHASAAFAAALASPSGGSSEEQEIQELQAAISLSLIRLRELRWRELVLQADISGAC